jgi:hypothetical protein
MMSGKARSESFSAWKPADTIAILNFASRMKSKYDVVILAPAITLVAATYPRAGSRSSLKNDWHRRRDTQKVPRLATRGYRVIRIRQFVPEKIIRELG